MTTNHNHPPVYSVGCKPSDYNMDGYTADKHNDGNYSFRKVPELLNKETKTNNKEATMAKATTKKATKKVAKKSVKKAATKKVAKKETSKKGPSLAKRCQEIILEQNKTDEEISKVLQKEFPNAKHNDAATVKYYRRQMIRKGEELEELVRQGKKLVPASSVEPVEKPSKKAAKKKEAKEEKTEKKTVKKSVKKKVLKKKVKKKAKKSED